MAAQVFGLEGGALAACALMQDDVFKVASHEQGRHGRFGQVNDVFLELRVGFFQVLASRLHLNGDLALPEIVNVACMTIVQRDLVFKIALAFRIAHPKNLQKGREKRLGLGFFVLCRFPAFGKGNGFGLNFFP